MFFVVYNVAAEGRNMFTRRTFLGLIGACAVNAERRPDDSPLDLIRSEREWPKRRQRIRDGMQQVMGPLPAKPKKAPRMEVVQEFSDGSYLRRKIRYESEA